MFGLVPQNVKKIMAMPLLKLSPISHVTLHINIILWLICLIHNNNKLLQPEIVAST